VNKQFLKELIAWIEAASLEDLNEKRETLAQKAASGQYEASELNLVIKIIDEEILAHHCLFKLENK
jgi:hypothetical protein